MNIFVESKSLNTRCLVAICSSPEQAIQKALSRVKEEIEEYGFKLENYSFLLFRCDPGQFTTMLYDEYGKIIVKNVIFEGSIEKIFKYIRDYKNQFDDENAFDKYRNDVIFKDYLEENLEENLEETKKRLKKD